MTTRTDPHLQLMAAVAPARSGPDAELVLRALSSGERVVSVVRVVGPAGAGKSAMVRRALAERLRGAHRVVWLDHAVVASPGALWGALAFALDLAPGSRAETVRRHLEARPHAVVIDGVDGALGALEPELAALLGGRTLIMIVGRHPETRLLPVATVMVPAASASRSAWPTLGTRHWRWLQALSVLGGGLTVEEACAVGQRVGVADAAARLAELLRDGAALGIDPHDAQRVRVPGYVRRALIGAAEPEAVRVALAFVAARARGDQPIDDRIDFADAARRLALMPLAGPVEARLMGDAIARWAVRWGMGGSGPFAPLVPARVGVRAGAPGAVLAEAEAALGREAWREAVAAFEGACVDGLTGRQHAGYAWALIEVGRHDDAGRHLARAEGGTGAMRAEPSAAGALSYLDRGLLDDAESRLSHEVMNAAMKGHRRSAVQTRFWLLCASVLREALEPFYALAVATELEREGEVALAAFARGLAARASGQLVPTTLDAARHPSTQAALDVLSGARGSEDGAEHEGLLVRIARLVVARSR
ncbi:MAG: hypothetical protein IT385_08785 [Deltaproteobacteria bacterium]|nr:hypothetical protein [Deltaproteobacteria bacterium]